MDRRLTVIIFVAAFALCALVTKPHALSWNDMSRVATIDALTTQHTFAIDASPFSAKTGDKYQYHGHTYSDKSPALALQGAVVASLLAPLGITLARTPERAVYLITLCTVGGWFALGCAYAFAFQRWLGVERRRAALVGALTGLGTLALPYATVLSNHVPSGAAALAGLYHLVRAREHDPVHASIGALYLTLAYAFDAPSIVFTLAAATVLWGASRRTWLTFATACVPILAAQFAYNASVSSGLGPPALNQATWSDPSSQFHRTDQSPFWFHSAGDYVRYAVYLLVGDKGLVSYTPLVMLCGYGLLRMRESSGARQVALAVTIACAAYYLLTVAFTNDYGALNYGERRYVNLFFVLCIGLGPALAGLPEGIALIAARAAVIASIAIASLGIVAPFGQLPGVPGYLFAPEEFARLASRAPVQAAIDVVALGITIFLVLRFWSSESAPTPDTARRPA